MSVGTIVTIVLLMSVLVLGIFLINKIFTSGTNAIDQIDAQVQSEINKLFSEEGLKLVVYPSSKDITLKKGDKPRGFAFSISNKEPEQNTFTYKVQSEEPFDFRAKCGSTISKTKADNYLLIDSGEISLGPSSSMDTPELVRFDVPETAPSCTIPYKINVWYQGGVPYTQARLFVTIK